MRFPLADWIDGHAECRHDLATSGMRGSVPAPAWPSRRPAAGAVAELHAELAEHLRVDPDRLALAHGASEANAWVLGFLGRTIARGGRTAVARVRLPEYPPLFDTARAVGFRLVDGDEPSDLGIVSRPRNPEGDLWSEEALADFARGSRHLLVDETFREFAEVPSVAARAGRGVWATGSFTKFFGADEVRVGFAVCPPGPEREFARYVGVVSDEVAPGSAAMALALLRTLPTVRREVRRVLDRNVAAFRRAYPGSPAPAAPLYFDRTAAVGGRALARRCLRASVLVCPGDLFGDPRGVRVTMTRRGFPTALAAYLAVRGPWPGGSAGKPRI